MNPIVVVAILALVMSAISLGWQIWSWSRSGAVVKVTSMQSLPLFDQGPGDWQVDVTARNTGRADVQVTSWGFATPTGSQLVVPHSASWSTKLPHSLESGTSASWYVPTEEIKRSCAENGVRYQDLHAFVRLGTGATVQASSTGIGLT